MTTLNQLHKLSLHGLVSGLYSSGSITGSRVALAVPVKLPPPKKLPWIRFFKVIDRPLCSSTHSFFDSENIWKINVKNNRESLQASFLNPNRHH